MDTTRLTDWMLIPICGSCSFEFSHHRPGQELPPTLKALRSSPHIFRLRWSWWHAASSPYRHLHSRDHSCTSL